MQKIGNLSSPNLPWKFYQPGSGDVSPTWIHTCLPWIMVHSLCKFCSLLSSGKPVFFSFYTIVSISLKNWHCWKEPQKLLTERCTDWVKCIHTLGVMESSARNLKSSMEMDWSPMMVSSPLKKYTRAHIFQSVYLKQFAIYNWGILLIQLMSRVSILQPTKGKYIPWINTTHTQGKRCT